MQCVLGVTEVICRAIGIVLLMCSCLFVIEGGLFFITQLSECTLYIFLLCFRKHYKEYLVDRINNAKLDPLPMYDKIELLLTREEKQVPEKEVDESDEDYRQRLIEVWRHKCIHLQWKL